MSAPSYDFACSSAGRKGKLIHRLHLASIPKICYGVEVEGLAYHGAQPGRSVSGISNNVTHHYLFQYPPSPKISSCLGKLAWARAL